MNSRNFWLGFLLAAAVTAYWLWQRQRADSAQLPVRAPRALSPTPVREPDPLEEIQGIGKVFANRLRAGGVETFADLASLPEARIRAIVAAQPWQADVASWIEQARARAGA